MSAFQGVRTTVTVRFHHTTAFRQFPRTAGFTWEDWAGDLCAYAINAKQGIDSADGHGERLARYLLYVQRLGALLGKVPGIGDGIEPLYSLRDELDLLLHHHSSDLLRPATAPRTMATNSDKRLRMIAVTCVRLFRQVGVSDEDSRERVAKIIGDRGYRGGRGKFGPDELANWVAKVESGELPGAEQIERLFRRLPSLRQATTLDHARGLAEQLLGHIRFPPLSGSQAKKTRPIA